MAHVVNTAITVSSRISIANKTVRPHPVNVLDRTAWFLGHDLPKTCVISGRRPIGNGQVATCHVTVEEHLDTEDLVVVTFVMRRQRQLAVGGHIYSDVQRILYQQCQSVEAIVDGVMSTYPLQGACSVEGHPAPQNQV